MTPPRRPLGPAPDERDLHDAALDYLARYAATEVGLRRVLERRIDRWARRAAALHETDAVAAQAAAARASVTAVVTRRSRRGR